MTTTGLQHTHTHTQHLIQSVAVKIFTLPSSLFSAPSAHIQGDDNVSSGCGHLQEELATSSLSSRDNPVGELDDDEVAGDDDQDDEDDDQDNDDNHHHARSIRLQESKVKQTSR